MCNNWKTGLGLGLTLYGKVVNSFLSFKAKSEKENKM